MRQSTFEPAQPCAFDVANLPMHSSPLSQPEGVFVPGDGCSDDHVVVVYPYGNTPPEITVQGTAGNVQTVMADGLAVAIVARANGPDLTASDVVLVERYAPAKR